MSNGKRLNGINGTKATNLKFWLHFLFSEISEKNKRGSGWLFRFQCCPFYFTGGVMPKTEFELELEALSDYADPVADDEVEFACAELAKLRINCGEGKRYV